MVPAVAGNSVVNMSWRSLLSERTLLLNVTFQPLSIISVRRAVLLVLAGKAETLNCSDEVLRSESLEIPVPSVIRLNYYVRAPFRSRAPLHRKALFARDFYLCQYCGERADCIDHVLPVSKGGRNAWENMVACCRPCNAAKADLLLENSRFKLKRPPYAPEPLAVAVAMKADVPLEWECYLPAALTLTA